MSTLKIVTLGLGASFLLGAAVAAEVPEKGYYRPYIVGADGRKHPRMDIPGSETVITRQMLDDQQATNLGQALRNAPGVFVRH